MITRRHWAFIAFFLFSLVVFRNAVSALVVFSLQNESSSHILLVPIVSLVLLFWDRQNVFSETHSSTLLGTALILAGGSIYWVADRYLAEGNGALTGAALSLVSIWIGGFLICYGAAATRRAAFALLFLLLMVPLPEAILARIIYLLQLGSTEVTCLLFKAAGVPVLREGFYLTVPGVTIEVATECSGIRSSMALFITCLLAAHLFLKTSWKKVAFLVLTFPFAVIKNGIRIATLTLLSVYVDPGFLTGSLHRQGGFVFFLFTLGLLGSVLFALRRSEDRLDTPRVVVSPTPKTGFARG